MGGVNPRLNTKTAGFTAVQLFDDTDPVGTDYDYSNLLPMLMGGARYTWDSGDDGVWRPVQVDGTPGLFGNWIIWPGTGDRMLTQIAQVFAVQITSTDGGLFATPILNSDGDLDTTLDEIEVHDFPGITSSEGDYGLVAAGTSLSSQELLFQNHGSGGGGGGGGGAWYGDGSDGAITIPLSTSSLNPITNCRKTSSGDGLTYGYADNIYIHSLRFRSLYCTDLTVPSGTVLFAGGPGPNAFILIHCTGTLTVDGEVTSGGDACGYLDSHFLAFGVTNVGGGFGGNGVSASNGQSGNLGGSSNGLPYDEGGAPGSPNPALYSGTGGNAGARTGGAGVGASYPPAKPGDGGAGLNSGSSYWLRALPGAATGQKDSSSVNTIGACSGGGGANGGSSTGGTGGYSGTLLIIRAKNIVGSGKIRADGGQGQPGVGASAGGGGGGNPGGVILITDNLDFSSGLTVTADPGPGGAGSGTGASGTAGGGGGFVLPLKPVA